MHSGRNVILVPDRFKDVTVVNCVKSAEKISSFRSQYITPNERRFEDIVEPTSSPSFEFIHFHSLHSKTLKWVNADVKILLFNRRKWHPVISKYRSPVRFWNETGNSFIMGSLTKRSFFIFPVFPKISGKFSRLKQSESSSSSREGKLRGGNLLSSAHSSAINILSLVRKPTESSTAIKLAHSLKESFSKFGRWDTSGICVKRLQ